MRQLTKHLLVYGILSCLVSVGTFTTPTISYATTSDDVNIDTLRYPLKRNLENVSIDRKLATQIDSIDTDEDLFIFYKKIQNMNEKDLDGLINYSLAASENKSMNSVIKLKAAWLAAAQVAKLNGYPLSAKLVEHSVFYRNYSETNGSFAKAIKKTSVYRIIKYKTHGSASFERKHSKDLYYSIHAFSYTSSASSYGKRIYLKDKFDFKYDNQIKGLFSRLVNNWGYLSQKMYVLHPIKVKVSIDA